MPSSGCLNFHNATVLNGRQLAALDELKSDGRTLILIGYPPSVIPRLAAEACCWKAR